MNKLLKYLPSILIIIALVILAMLYFKMPNNLKEALRDIKEAQSNINSSLDLLDEQQGYLDSLITINKALLGELDSLKLKNTNLTTSIDDKLKNAQYLLWTIKNNIDKLPKRFETPE